MKKRKQERFKDYKEVKMPSHMVDSIYLKKDGQGLIIIFATGHVVTFLPIKVECPKK